MDIQSYWVLPKNYFPNQLTPYFIIWDNVFLSNSMKWEIHKTIIPTLQNGTCIKPLNQDTVPLSITFTYLADAFIQSDLQCI